ncbi:hypothetical protein N431DRAFT_456154 [Stipitochalara longipes BDJ]|nr:hypothetical protein N431DRAFT_456154 [Stipitochalara longipes BDJ]
MAGYWYPNSGDFTSTPGGGDLNPYQLSQQGPNTTSDASNGYNATASGSQGNSQTFNQGPAVNTAASGQSASSMVYFGSAPVPRNMSTALDFNDEMGKVRLDKPLHQVVSGVVYGNGTHSFDSSQTSAMSRFGPPTTTAASNQHHIQYPNQNILHSTASGDSRYIQSERTPMGTSSLSSNNYQPSQLHNQPPMLYQSPHTASPSWNPLASAVLQAANDDSDEGSELEEDFLHPDTGRPVRTLLDHEKVLLKHFFRLKNPFTPVPSPRQVYLWQLNLPDKVQDEWNQFVLSNQTQTQARDRQESAEQYRSMLISIKNKVYAETKSVIRGSRHGKVGRPVGSKNKSKNVGSTMKGVGVSNKATQTKSAGGKKGKAAAQQLSDDGNDDFDPDQQLEEDEEIEEDNGEIFDGDEFE